MFGPAALVTLWLFPISWVVPLFETETLFFLRNEVSILIGIESLFEIDPFLCVVVVLFSIVAPTAKSLVILWAWYRCPIASLKPFLVSLTVLGKLSMAEVFLIAVALIAFKGVGLGQVHVLWGLYFYTGVILLSLAQSLIVSSDPRQCPIDNS